MVVILLRYLVLALGLCIIGGTLLSLSRHPHWLVRGWDFPRVHIATLGVVSGGAYAAFFCTWQWPEWLFLLALMGCVAWQCYRIFPYTPLAAVQVQRSRAPTPEGSLRLLIANVLMQNHAFDRFVQLVRTVDPDMILAVEIDDRWLVQLQPLEQIYPYAVRQPQDNMYGMLLLSRLQLINPHVRFMVQKDIPSIHTEVELRNGVRVVFYGLHPRPPEPLRDQDATPRNAELLLVGDEISTHNRPSVVAGDLNDVAWSKTTEFFLRLSGLLDPRVGRGFYNTFNAHNPVFRFPWIIYFIPPVLPSVRCAGWGILAQIIFLCALSCIMNLRSGPSSHHWNSRQSSRQKPSSTSAWLLWIKAFARGTLYHSQTIYEQLRASAVYSGPSWFSDSRCVWHKICSILESQRASTMTHGGSCNASGDMISRKELVWVRRVIRREHPHGRNQTVAMRRSTRSGKQERR